MKLMKIYLNSSHIEHENKYYTQREGVCIGSVIASITTELFMTNIYRSIQKKLDDLGIEHHVTILRFVDDF
jgi:hypothetical protein